MRSTGHILSTQVETVGCRIINVDIHFLKISNVLT
nr:MAG TPA: hypothetical protein [Caudoviricetes sp.]DAS28876.1 MAG TPA: hypothetical protein [Caudoviricetes sp.]DAS30727.1 MAG TPA: hypothetical protein [Caudoviricetes sp.]